MSAFVRRVLICGMVLVLLVPHIRPGMEHFALDWKISALAFLILFAKGIDVCARRDFDLEMGFASLIQLFMAGLEDAFPI